MLAALLALVLLAAGSGRVFPQFAARALDAPEFLEAAYQGDRANAGDRVKLDVSCLDQGYGRSTLSFGRRGGSFVGSGRRYFYGDFLRMTACLFG